MSGGADDILASAAAWLAQRDGGSRRAASAALSETYRRGGASDRIDFSAYLTVRLPATYAAVSRVLGEVALRRPRFAPRSLLDAGSGPGTASWAAAARWASLSDVTMLDSKRDFLALAGELARALPVLARAEYKAGDIASALPEADLVVAAYALAEVPAHQQVRAVTGLWAAAREMLVLVEPGTPAGFIRLRAARDLLLKEGSVAVAPCPHDEDCPMAGEDWCHFSVRLPRSRAHMHAKQVKLPFEDEKFAYLAVARSGEMSGGARVLSPPTDTKPGRSLKLCTIEGLERRFVPRRDKAHFRRYRKINWGDLIS